MTEHGSTQLDTGLVDVFCRTFGEQHRQQLSLETNMDDIPEWDSMSFLDLVLAVEEEYQVEFTVDETSEMFQLGHIQRIIDSATKDIPHDDVTNSCCLLDRAKSAPPETFKMFVISGSSTREGLVLPREADKMACEIFGRKTSCYNLSTSGLVAAETLQLLEVLGENENVAIAVGMSPVIMAGCDPVQFRRAANHARFPFHAPRMETILRQNDYLGDDRPLQSLDLWVQRYLKGRDLEELHYDPYIYPTLAPWDNEKFDSEEDILRYYNDSIVEHAQSREINAQIFEGIADWSESTQSPLVLLELTLHSKAKSLLESLGGVMTWYDGWLADFTARRNIPLINAVQRAGIVDADMRDPGHIFQKREEYTREFLRGVRDVLADGQTRRDVA